ncbi:MAG: F0F1 ATP synthase subunit B [Candidatus Competibacteraceae bacterium]|nr:MAG: F0F1 ATP synthase subunit B [Candidatus Competibacteraceae bacterium]
MQIDWFTVAAQIVNFLLLVWLLKRFLYRPVLDAMAARQQKIAAALEEARTKTQQAESAAQAGRERQAVLEAQREAWLAEARQEVADQREAWLSAARREVEAQRADWLAAWRREQAEGQHALQREAVHRLTEALRHALRELADADLERRMFEPLLTRLRALDVGERAALAQAALGGCTVTTAFSLDTALQQDWRTMLHSLLGTETSLSFHHDPNAACGITLEMPGHRLAWTLDSYLDGFGAALAQALNSRISTVADDHARS